jgi:signal transduction histidine kinase/ActR/RegA family two-component response regulator
MTTPDFRPDHPGEVASRLREAEATIDAIRNGEVDAVVVEGPHGPQIYSLESPDRPFRSFVENMRQGALTLDEDDMILYANAFFAELLETPLENVIGSRLSEFIAPGDAELYRQLRHNCDQRPNEGVLHLRTPAGKEGLAWFSFSFAPGSNPAACCVVIQDLRDQEKARAEQVAREAAEAASLAKDQFLALLSHELRSPIHSILGWAQILKRMNLKDAELLRGLETIERNARAQASLVNDLLDMSRITSGKLQLVRRTVDAHEVVDSAVASIAPLAGERRITVESSAPPGRALVDGDLDRLQQVVWNLLANAVKYTPEDGRIRIGIQRAPSLVEIEVEDDGQGISPEFLPRVFDLFQQAETPINRCSSGLGLGLAIVKQIIELHGGSVSVRSDGVGRGSVCTVRLPATENTASASAVDPSKAQDGCLEGARVLVVDDDPDAREILLRGLSRLGADVLLAGGTEEALAIAASATPHLLVADLAMPRGDGFELIRKLRSTGFAERKLPAIALSAMAGPDDRARALESGYQMHVPKPIDVETLLSTASELIAGRETG